MKEKVEIKVKRVICESRRKLANAVVVAGEVELEAVSLVP